jgi:hypothetical protein
MITAALKEGNVMFRRGIFRRFNKLFRGDLKLHESIRNDPQFQFYAEVLDWVLNTETVYENSHQKAIKGT